MNALTRKAVADVTRRAGRTILMVLGIMIGVLGITAVNQANSQIGGTFFLQHRSHSGSQHHHDRRHEQTSRLDDSDN